MKDPRGRSAAAKRPAAERLAEDLAAFRTETARDLPPIGETVRAAQRRIVRPTREEWTMKVIRSLRLHPYLVTAGVTVAIALILLAIPISYTRTVGYDIRISLSEPLPDIAQLSRLAGELRKTLKTDAVTLQHTSDSAILLAQTPLRPRAGIEKTAAAFAGALSDLGYAAESAVAPRTERVSGSVYAAGLQQVIQIRVQSEGKTPDQIASEIRDQLLQAGFTSADVQVTDEGDQRQIQVKIEKEGEPGEECCPEINISIDDQPAGGDRKMVRIQKTPEMTDDELRSEVERQLREQGSTNPQVEVRDGRIISIQP